MHTQAYFEDIQSVIIQHLQQARQEILVAVAWFTDGDLLRVLCQKAQTGVAVTVLFLDDSINTSLNFNQLTEKGGKLWRVPVHDQQRNPMHNKFCVIDQQTVITGSYNWTYKAQHNDENITITKQQPAFAAEYVLEFQRLQQKYFGGQTATDYTAVLKRLEILRAAVALQDTEDISAQAQKLQKLLALSQPLAELSELLDLLHAQRYGEASRLIEDFLEKYKTVTVYTDTEVFGLRLELKSLQLQISTLEDEKTEIEKTIHHFEQEYSREVGDLLLKVLELRSQKAQQQAQQAPKDEAKQQYYKQTRHEYEQYQYGFEQEKQQAQPFALNADEQKKLKEKYRKASKLCHPDTVTAEQKAEAEQLFDRLTKAYDNNDLQTVSEILDFLENGKPLQNRHETLTEKAQLQAEISRLREKLQLVLATIHQLKNSETYQLILSIADRAAYFEQLRTTLREEIALYEEEVS
jgi:hypothetical protein